MRHLRACARSEDQRKVFIFLMATRPRTLRPPHDAIQQLSLHTLQAGFKVGSVTMATIIMIVLYMYKQIML